MKFNWKVRIKHPSFWIATVPVVITFVYSVLALAGIVPSITEDSIHNLVVAIVAVLAQLGVTVDPTTKGLGDSEKAMTYDKPN